MRQGPRRGGLAALLLSAHLASSGCAHGHPLTNRQVAIGVIVGSAAVVLIVLAVTQCHKGAAYCDDSPPGQ